MSKSDTNKVLLLKIDGSIIDSFKKKKIERQTCEIKNVSPTRIIKESFSMRQKHTESLTLLLMEINGCYDIPQKLSRVGPGQ